MLGQILIATYFHFNNELISLIPNSKSLIPFLGFPITLSLLTTAYLPIKQLIKTNSKNKQELASFKKWKTDASLFMAQWEKEPTCDNAIWENDLLIGNADAPIRITVACNPYCVPCAKAHEELDELVEKYPNKIGVQVRLLCNPDNITDKLTVAVNAILQQAQILEDNSKLKIMLSNWFAWMDYDKWSEVWKLNSNINVQHILTKHKNWNNETGVTHTPTIFINGKKLPGRYNINDIEKMVLQLEYAFVET